MILIIDTTETREGQKLTAMLDEMNRGGSYKYIDAADMNISHCLGCNYCWLKTPGQCVVKDDYEPVLKEMSKADQVWLVSDTKFGFVSYKTKNIIDRVMPLVTMNLHFVGKQMRHVMRYDHNPDFAVIYAGEGDQEYLEKWCERVALNFGSKSRGAFSVENCKETVACM